MTNFSFALALNTGSPQSNTNHQTREPRCHHHQQRERTPEKPERNQFLDFLTAPLEMLGKGGNQNDKEYDKYLAANHAGNLLKG